MFQREVGNRMNNVCNWSDSNHVSMYSCPLNLHVILAYSLYGNHWPYHSWTVLIVLSTIVILNYIKGKKSCVITTNANAFSILIQYTYSINLCVNQMPLVLLDIEVLHCDHNIHCLTHSLQQVILVGIVDFPPLDSSINHVTKYQNTHCVYRYGVGNFVLLRYHAWDWQVKVHCILML